MLYLEWIVASSSPPVIWSKSLSTLQAKMCGCCYAPQSLVSVFAFVWDCIYCSVFVLDCGLWIVYNWIVASFSPPEIQSNFSFAGKDVWMLLCPWWQSVRKIHFSFKFAQTTSHCRCNVSLFLAAEFLFKYRIQQIPSSLVKFQLIPWASWIIRKAWKWESGSVNSCISILLTCVLNLVNMCTCIHAHMCINWDCSHVY